SHGVRLGLLRAFEQVADDDAVKGVVLACRGRTFIAGADITEFGKPPKAPGLQEPQTAIEDCPKPVVAAIHGTALGGGLEVAMCAHYRVGDPAAQYGQPEVKLGLLPGAGGTQRLPRVTGVAKALEMCAIGDPIGSQEALAAGLIDAIIEGDLIDGAVAFAEQLVAEGAPLKKIRDRDEKIEEARANRAVFDDFRKSIARKTRNFHAPAKNVDLIEAALDTPFDDALKQEAEVFEELMAGRQSQAQRYYFFAERQAAKVPDLPRDTALREVKTVGILGAGTMGGGIAMNFLNAGVPVKIVERDRESLERGIAVVRKNYQRSARRGRFTMEQVEERMSLLDAGTDKSVFADVDMVIEAVFELMPLKKSVFTELDAICREGAILATNTSGLNVNEIAAVTKRPHDVIGTHFFSPANVMKLLEIVRGDETAEDVLATTLQVSKTIGKIPAVVGVAPGFVGNRLLHQRGLEAERLILEGAPPARVDSVLYEFGLPMGPFAMGDLAGLDVGWDPDDTHGRTIREVLCESGRRGQKNGRGYYIYDPETRAPSPDPEVLDLIRDFASRHGVAQRDDHSDEEILDRCLLPMANMGAKILEEGKAMRSSDIDVVWVNGYGWPVYQGGPMFWAEGMGLDTVAAKIKHYGAKLGGAHWELSPLIEQLASEGKSFQDLPPQKIR
ncbi:MAG: 3-hydroxyacyl-CoA dehydrogenase NAD-binding domain-containing protein, partial [Chloroflexota bacterium]|nr:3-hydroxyacyl-CoA dehydrogenase NAD-binding domain-containing protein [Chloroflexota bacterium]